MTESLFNQGFDLMLYGMGTVFVFLMLLIGVTVLISRGILRFFPELPVVTEVGAGRLQAQPNVDAQTLRVIKAALDQHRARR